jgi:hypothetical protein
MGILPQCFIKRHLIKVWPQRFAKVQLGIRRLPEQEIAQAFFATGSNDEIGVRAVR